MASRSAARFRAILSDHGLDDTVRELTDSARTAQQAADALACDVGQIVKSLVFADEAGEPVLVLASGDVRVDPDRVGTIHGRGVSMAHAQRVREVAGYAIGGVPPFGHNRPLLTLIDNTLRRWDIVWAAAGTPHHVFSLTVDELVRVSEGHFADVSG